MFLFWLLIIFLIGLAGYEWLLSYFKSRIENRASETVDEAKRFIGFDFGNDYDVIEHRSNNLHPDKPVGIVMRLKDKSLESMLVYFENIDFEGSGRPNPGTTQRPDLHWRKSGREIIGERVLCHQNSDGSTYPFWSGTIRFYIDEKVIVYSESFI